MELFVGIGEGSLRDVSIALGHAEDKINDADIGWYVYHNIDDISQLLHWREDARHIPAYEGNGPYANYSLLYDWRNDDNVDQEGLAAIIDRQDKLSGKGKYKRDTKNADNL